MGEALVVAEELAVKFFGAGHDDGIRKAQSAVLHTSGRRSFSDRCREWRDRDAR
jgi:hypothetical protein